MSVTLVLAGDTSETVDEAFTFVWCLCFVCFVSVFRVARLVVQSVCMVLAFSSDRLLPVMCDYR